MCTVPGLRRFCRESYNEPGAVYEKLKSLGMDLVTITDHDSIDAAEELRRHPDFFLSEEVTCRMPSGTELHVGIYDITERDHLEIKRRRHALESLAAYLEERRLLFSANHVFSSLTGRRRLEDFNCFGRLFPAIEARNGLMQRALNRRSEALAAWMSKPAVGGSDAHAMPSVGNCFTEVHGAGSKREFLQGLRAGQGRVEGGAGGWWPLTRDVLLIGAGMARENRWKATFAPLGLAVPLITAGNWVLEEGFSRWWFYRVRRRVRRSMNQKGCTAPAEVAV
jgi:predicted metal-dependent phosphoesterase TrpH